MEANADPPSPHVVPVDENHLTCMKKLRATDKAIEQRFPRSYNIFTNIVLPLFFLIGLSFFCGYFVVMLESPGEVESNDGLIADFVDFAVRASSRPVQVDSVRPIELCVVTINVTDTSSNTSALARQLADCAESFVGQEVSAPVTFDWTACNVEDPSYASQRSTVIEAWLESYESLVEYNMQLKNMTFLNAHTQALEAASGHAGCTINTAAGALFCFTVMTTVGYGNAVPSSQGAQALVYSLGFISILAFTAIISQAGTICLAVCDDFFHRIKAHFLTKGVWASLVWLAAWWLWVLTFAGIATGSSGRTFPLQNSFWFSYISTTTVGLGDYYIPHETFRPGDMFFLPLLFLLGFVLLSNFLHKFSDLLSSFGSERESLDSLLETRRGAAKERSQKGLIKDGEEEGECAVEMREAGS